MNTFIPGRHSWVHKGSTGGLWILNVFMGLCPPTSQDPRHTASFSELGPDQESGEPPIVVIKSSQRLHRLHSPSLEAASWAKRALQTCPGRWGGHPRLWAGRQAVPPGSWGTFQQALSRGQCIRRTWLGPQTVTRPEAAMTHQTSVSVSGTHSYQTCQIPSGQSLIDGDGGLEDVK